MISHIEVVISHIEQEHLTGAQQPDLGWGPPVPNGIGGQFGGDQHHSLRQPPGAAASGSCKA